MLNFTIIELEPSTYVKVVAGNAVGKHAPTRNISIITKKLSE